MSFKELNYDGNCGIFLIMAVFVARLCSDSAQDLDPLPLLFLRN